MKEIRNPDGRLACRADEENGRIEILEKGWITVVWFNPDGKVETAHSRSVRV